MLEDEPAFPPTHSVTVTLAKAATDLFKLPPSQTVDVQLSNRVNFLFST